MVAGEPAADKGPMMGGGPTGRGGDGCWAAGGVKSAAKAASESSRGGGLYNVRRAFI
jgi:hypothetical protein